MDKIVRDLRLATAEKDVENVYRARLKQSFPGSKIVSPFNTDGCLEKKKVRALLEFKYDKNLKSKVQQVNILMQMLYYVKRYEDAGRKLPNILFVGDKNECFALHTNAIIKYLSSEIDWTTAPSSAHRDNPVIVKAMVDDTDILPFVFDIDHKFDFSTVIEAINDLAYNVVRKVRVTSHNIYEIYEYFIANVMSGFSLKTNEMANLFIQLIVNPKENFIHPRKKNILVTKSYGNMKISQTRFESFFRHFEGESYSPKEKEVLTGIIDRLIDDEKRRRSGEFFTPTAWVNEAHKMIEESFGLDWKEQYIVYDCACGTLNLTRDYKFKELYCSTLEESDLETARQMNYNPEATLFQYDFLNDGLEKLPQGLLNAIEEEKEIIFFINPPYGTANNMGTKEGDHKSGIANTDIGDTMKKVGLGRSSQQLYAQFMYKISQFENVHLAVFSPSLYKTGGSHKIFRKNFYNKFQYDQGMLFNASHFSDAVSTWGVDFSIWKSGVEIRNSLPIIVKDTSETGIIKLQDKDVCNLDNSIKASDWIRKEIKKLKTNKNVPQLTSALGVKTKGKTMRGSIIDDKSFGYFLNASNNTYENTSQVAIFTWAMSKGNGLSIIPENFHKVTTLFTARKSIKSTWINQKDEYSAPNENHPEWHWFVNDSIVYSLFNNSSQQSSLRQVTYRDKKWDIINEFFYMSVDEMKDLANEYQFDDLYQDARTARDRYVYRKLEGLGLSDDARGVLDTARELVRESFKFRETMHSDHLDYHLDAWDAGYAQLKLLWKEFMPEKFKQFREDYKLFEKRLIPLVYDFGFLRR